jgi:hypothetical protein
MSIMFPQNLAPLSKLLRLTAFVAIVAIALGAATSSFGSRNSHAHSLDVEDTPTTALGYAAYKLLDSDLAGYAVGGAGAGGLGFLGGYYGGTAAGAAWMSAKLGMKIGTVAGGAIGAAAGGLAGAL